MTFNKIFPIYSPPRKWQSSVTHMFGCKSNASCSQREDYNWLWSVWGSPLPANTMWHLPVHKHTLCQIGWGWWTSGLNSAAPQGEDVSSFHVLCGWAVIKVKFSLPPWWLFVATVAHLDTTGPFNYTLLTRAGHYGLRDIRPHKIKSKDHFLINICLLRVGSRKSLYKET